MDICPSCGRSYQKNASHQKHCVFCAYEINKAKSVMRARQKRAAKEQGQ